MTGRLSQSVWGGAPARRFLNQVRNLGCGFALTNEILEQLRAHVKNGGRGRPPHIHERAKTKRPPDLAAFCTVEFSAYCAGFSSIFFLGAAAWALGFQKSGSALIHSSET